MRTEFERSRKDAGGVMKAAASVALLALIVAAGGRSLAPLTMSGPDDRTPLDVLATDTVYRYAASYSTQLEAADEAPERF